MPRLLHAVARPGNAHVIAPLFSDDIEAALDQGQILAVLAEQHGCQPVIVERQHELSCRGTCLRHPRGSDGCIIHAIRAQEPQPPPSCASRVSAPKRLFELAWVIVTAAILPIQLAGAMTWTG